MRKIADIKHHASDPADFSTNLCQPEKDVNGELIHHREDHNHLLKRIAVRLREGLIPGVDLRYLRDALHDPSTGLTYEALRGKNKQSVPDCEHLINPGVISFLERKGDTSGAHVIRLIHNWHKAVDGRGLSEEQRSSYCQDMKEWLLADWMPWFHTLPEGILSFFQDGGCWREDAGKGWVTWYKYSKILGVFYHVTLL